MKPRITQTDIARVAGVHNTTVSLALRNCAAIPEETRRRIQVIAENLGYYPDPALQALVAYRNSRRSHAQQHTIAYITNWTTQWGWRNIPYHAQSYAGAMARAAQLGCQLEHFWLGEPNMTAQRLSNVLFHRGITGAILAAHLPNADEMTGFEWDRISAVAIGCFPQSPALNRVLEDQIGAVRLAMRRTRAAGYRRIGLFMPAWWDDLVDQAWSGGFIMEQRWLPAELRLPVFRRERAEECIVPFDDPSPGKATRDNLAGWIERHQPDAILTFSSDLESELQDLGVSVPEDVALVNLSAHENDHRWSGVRQNSKRVGELAVEMVVNAMQHNMGGIPSLPMTTTVAGTWIDGDSLPLTGTVPSLKACGLAKA